MYAGIQVEQTEELMQQAKQKVAAVASQSKSVSNGAKGVAQASEEQLAALAKANGMLAGCTAATEKALAALRSCAISSPACILVTTPWLGCLWLVVFRYFLMCVCTEEESPPAV